MLLFYFQLDIDKTVLIFIFQKLIVETVTWLSCFLSFLGGTGVYCAFHKHANSKVQNPPSQLRFALRSIIITITSNKSWNTETHKTDWNPPITNHKPWPIEPVKVKFCFLRGLLRWLTAAKTAIVFWLLNFRIRMFVKSAVILKLTIIFVALTDSGKIH